MKTSTQIISIMFLIFASNFTLTISQPVLACSNCNNTNGNYTRNSTYETNLKTLLNTISSNTQIINGFYNFSVGQGPNKVYGLALCRADQTLTDCHRLLSDATKMLLDDCPVQKEAIGYYFGGCMLRYSNRPIFNSLINSPNCTVAQSALSIPNLNLRNFNQSLDYLLEGLKKNASIGNSSYKFSSGVVKVTEDVSVYGLAQCNPNLSLAECSDCLEGVIGSLQRCCSTLNGAGTYGPVCSVEFGNYPLLINAVNNAPLSPNQPAPAGGSGDSRTKSGKNRSNAYKKWIVVVGVVSFILISTLILALSRRHMRNKLNQENSDGRIKLVDSLKLDFDSICFATDNFSDSKRIDNGNATAIYKGVLHDGQEIAVKRLHKGNDRDSELEFSNEVLLSANLQHKNLVKLLGFCNDKDQRILAYEFLQNGSLHDFLDDPVKRASLDWQTRYHIINGFARGLLYLHEDSQVPVIHRDLKPSNILLGAQMDPKITNFRTACLVHADQTRGHTGVVGTYGYMPLEYVQQGHSSVKSDVFSFGVILLEIISGYMTCGFSDGVNEESLLIYAWRKWCEGTTLDMVDEALPNVDKHTKQIKRCIEIALLCVQEDPRQRPYMSTVVLMLSSETVDIPQPIRPSPLVINNMDSHSNRHSVQTHSSHETSVNEISYSYIDPR